MTNHKKAALRIKTTDGHSYYADQLHQLMSLETTHPVDPNALKYATALQAQFRATDTLDHLIRKQENRFGESF